MTFTYAAMLIILAVALDVYLAITVARLRAATRRVQETAAAPRPKPMLPRITIDEHQRIVGMRFAEFDLDSGESVELMVPIIEGLGQAVFEIEHARGSQKWLLDFDTGKVSPFTEVPGAFRDAFE